MVLFVVTSTCSGEDFFSVRVGGSGDAARAGCWTTTFSVASPPSFGIGGFVHALRSGWSISTEARFFDAISTVPLSEMIS